MQSKSNATLFLWFYRAITALALTGVQAGITGPGVSLRQVVHCFGVEYSTLR